MQYREATYGEELIENFGTTGIGLQSGFHNHGRGVGEADAPLLTGRGQVSLHGSGSTEMLRREFAPLL